MGMFSQVNTDDILKKIAEVKAAARYRLERGEPFDILAALDRIEKEVKDCQRLADAGW